MKNNSIFDSIVVSEEVKRQVDRELLILDWWIKLGDNKRDLLKHKYYHSKGQIEEIYDEETELQQILEEAFIKNNKIKNTWTKEELQEIFLGINKDNFLLWIRNRLEKVYNENPNYNHMLKLKEITDFITKNL